MTTNHPISTRRRRGFTLVEVLVALSMVAIILPIAMQGISAAARVSSHARRVSEAAELGRMKLNELTMDADTAKFTGQGDFGNEWPDYQWQATSVSRDYSLYEVTVVVKWQQLGQEDTKSVSTLVYVSSTTTESTQ